MNQSVITSLGIFLVLQLVTSVWWASKMNTLLTVLQREVQETLSEIKSMKSNYVTMGDCKSKCMMTDKEIEALWKRVDEINRSV
jgi:hypothetical protein